MNVYAIADLHLSFSVGPEKSMDMFGNAWVNHAERLKTNWEKIITDDDLVIMPGDFSWALRLEETGPDFAYFNSLPGKKLMIRGNHDLWWAGVSKMRKMYPDIVFLQNDSYVPEHEGDTAPFAVIGSRGWLSPGDNEFKEDTDRKIYERERMRLELSFKSLGEAKYDRLICAIHYPPQGFMDLFEEYHVNNVVYGHLHGENAFKNGPEGLINGIEYRLVSLDRLNCVPQLIMKGV
jgi:hypothetical protein